MEAALAGAPWARIVRYEDLVADPAGGFARIADFLGRELRELPDFETDSTSVAKSRRRVPVGRRTDDWRARLPAAEIDAIMAVVEKLFPEFVVMQSN